VYNKSLFCPPYVTHLKRTALPPSFTWPSPLHFLFPAWWQRVWDLHNRSRVRVMACISCKSLGQSGFYSLTWAHKVHFLRVEVTSNPKKNPHCISFNFWTFSLGFSRFSSDPLLSFTTTAIKKTKEKKLTLIIPLIGQIIHFQAISPMTSVPWGNEHYWAVSMFCLYLDHVVLFILLCFNTV